MDKGQFIRHDPCPNCSSSDALAVYDNNTATCFSCGQYIGNYEDGEMLSLNKNRRLEMSETPLIRGEYKELRKRGISLDTCKKYGYHIAQHNGSAVQVADYFDDKDNLIGQKIRYPDKSFRTIGTVNPSVMFGKKLWRSKGRQLIITEGEIDALSVAEAFGAKYPVVSLPNGAQSASKVITENLEWIEGFNTVLLWFDNDSAGKEAVEKVMPLISAGKVKVIRTDHKDANELLLAEGKSAVVNATYEAKEWRPDGIFNAAELWDKYKEKQVFETFKYPYPKLDFMYKGLRKGELVTFTAGSGMGKSTVVRELAYDLMFKQDCKVGYVALEENWRRTLTSFMGMYSNKPLFFDNELTSEEEKEAWENTIGKEKLYLYDHFGSIETENLLAKIRVMIHNCGVDFVVLDHISIVVSGMEGGDERRSIDNLMTMLRSIVEETQVGMLIISHLRRASGDKGHENGANITLSQLRGSGAIAQLSDGVIGLERDAQHETEGDRIRIRVLKNRFGGSLGKADSLNYNHKTGRIELVDEEFEETGNEESDF